LTQLPVKKSSLHFSTICELQLTLPHRHTVTCRQTHIPPLRHNVCNPVRTSHEEEHSLDEYDLASHFTLHARKLLTYAQTKANNTKPWSRGLLQHPSQKTDPAYSTANRVYIVTSSEREIATSSSVMKFHDLHMIFPARHLGTHSPALMQQICVPTQTLILGYMTCGMKKIQTCCVWDILLQTISYRPIQTS